METTHQPKFVRWALMLGIIIILNVFFSVIVSLAYPAPDYNKYCPNIQPSVTAADSAACEAQGGVWNAQAVDQTGASKASPSGYCDMYAKCQPLYQAANDQHALYAFVITVGLGILALIVGLFVPIGSSIVSSGLSYGGVLAFVVASTEYWGTAGNWVRLFISTVGLIALIYIGWRRFKD